MIRPPNIIWRCIGVHPEGDLWAVGIPTGVLIRFCYVNVIPEVRQNWDNNLCFVPGLFIVNDDDNLARLEVME